MHRRRISLLPRACALLLLLAPGWAGAQDLVRFEHLTIDDGLSQNEVSAALQDSLGFLWIGTSGGLNRYDGYEFAVFQLDPADPTSISGNQITALMQATDSTLWVGTTEGLNRYDREMVTFTVFRNEARNPATIASNRISALHEDASGKIWIGHANPDDPTVGGLSRLDPLSGHIERMALTSGEESLPVYAFAETTDGVLWIATGDGLYRYDTVAKAVTSLSHNPEDANSLAGDDIRELLVDSEGLLWIGLWGEGLDCYDPASGEFTHHEPGPEGTQLNSGYISAIGQTRDGILWVGTANPNGAASASLHRYDFKSFSRFSHDPNRETTVGPGTVRAIVEDSAHMLWVATDLGGICRFDQVTQPIPHFFPVSGDLSSLSSADVSSFLDEGKDILWVGTDEGLDRFDRFNGAFGHHRHRPGSPSSLSDDRVTALAAWRGDTMWVGTENGLNRFDRASGVFRNYAVNDGTGEEGTDNAVRALYADTQRNQLWIGTGHGLVRMDVTTGEITHVHGDPDNASVISDDQIVALYASEDIPHTLWVGTENGLNSVDLESGEISQFTADARNPDALSHRQVTSVSTLPGDSNALWVGTLAGGLNRLDLATGTFQRFTRRNSGLPGNAIYSIQPDDDGLLWLATNQGLVCFDPSRSSLVRVYGTDAGVQSRQFNVGASYRTQRGEIALGGSNGFNIFSPKDFRDSPYAPKVVITGYQVDGRAQAAAAEAVLLAEEITLPHDQNDLAFDFVGLHFSRPEENQYRVRLERKVGDSTEWRELGTQRTTTYANLTPGRYTFFVQASNGDGVWSQQTASVRVRITPPWWRTWLFRIFALFLVVGIGVAAYRRRIRRIAARNHELEELVTERTEELEQKTGALESKNEQLNATLGQLRTAQSQLVQAEKLASLGRVTAGVAHEIKNPLNFINNFAQLSEELAEELRHELAASADRPASEVLGDVDAILTDLALNSAKIAEHGRRADGIVKSMLLHARGTSGDPEPTPLHTLLDETIGLVVHGSGSGGDGVPVNVEKDYDERIGDVTIVRQAIGRVVLNLLENAVYAMRKHTASAVDYVPTVSLRTVDLGENVRIVVKDNGPGIPDDVLLRLFEPFFTTKPTGEGTGLGLSLAHDIILSHQGEITVASSAEDGTTFTIVLPKKLEELAGAEPIV